MVRRLWNTAIERASLLALDELPDAELLSRFLADRAGPAFAAVVRRHGPLVWGVCRNLLPSEADAEDAFQATFLALAKSAAGIRNPNALGAWLHAVAGRACRMTVRARARRVRRERAAAVREADDPIPEDAWDRWQAAVHAEVDRLPKPLREAFVLCVLQGVRQPDAAKRLGWSLGSVSARVCQAKKRLVAALSRRGLTGAAGAAAVLGSGAAAGPVSVELLSRATAVGAGGPVPEVIHQLARGAIGGVMGKTKLLAAGLVAAGLAIGSGLIPTAGGQGAPPMPTEPRRPNPPATVPAPTAGRPSISPMAAAPSATKWEYKYKPHTADAGATIGLLDELGAEGWEYVGPLPGARDLLVFKRPVSGTVPSRPMRTTGGDLRSASNPLTRPERTPALAGSSDLSPPSATGSAPRVPGEEGSVDTILPPARVNDPRVGPAALTSKAAAVIELAAGETIRHQMRTGGVIVRIKAAGPAPVAEASADPTDAKRVLIKAGTKTGDADLLLTDASGVQEVFKVRVR
jgi:RNA polymerase sigma factor (sigma-70 family)